LPVPVQGAWSFEKGTILMKKNAIPQKIRLSRETLLRLNPEQLGLPVGGVVTVGRACEPTSQCGTTTQCSITACGHC
jgi:hypothetical protein